MKRALTIIVIFLFAFTSTLSFAETDNKDQAMIGDTFIMRPLGIVSTVIGAVVFVVALPYSITGGNVRESGRTLVGAPAKFTFARPVGDFGNDK